MSVVSIVIILLIIAVILFGLVWLRQRSFGSLSGKSIYSDTQQIPGEVLYSDTYTLKGKPDYILKRGKDYIPVELKTGKTPYAPYNNHIMQLLAYCVLVEENYTVIPKYGIIKYPEKEFAIKYSPEKKKALQQLIREMNDLKTSGIEPHCKHPEHR